MRVDFYFAYRADDTKITADSPWSLRFADEPRASAIFREEEVWDARRGRWITEISKARD